MGLIDDCNDLLEKCIAHHCMCREARRLPGLNGADGVLPTGNGGQRERFLVFKKLSPLVPCFSKYDVAQGAEARPCFTLDE